MNKSIRPPPYYLLCLLCSGFMLFQDRQCILEAFDELLRVFGTTSTKQRHTGESGGEGEGEGEGGFRNGRCLTNSGHLRSLSGVSRILKPRLSTWTMMMIGSYQVWKGYLENFC